jgi:hypothetical protein
MDIEIFRVKATHLGSGEVQPPTLILTERALIRRDPEGLSKHTVEVPLDQIASIRLTENALYATLSVVTEGGEVVETRGLPKAEARELNGLIGAARGIYGR